MKKVCMVEYQGRVDEEGCPVGHGPKVLLDYYCLLKDRFDISVYGTKEIMSGFRERENAKGRILPGRIVMKGHKSFADKIFGKLSMFRNIHLAFKDNEAETIWFFNTEYYLMLYLALASKRSLKNKKIVATMFLDGYHGGFVNKVKQFVFEQAQKKIDVIVSSGFKFAFKNCKSEFIPDYYYVPEKYEEYRDINKQDKCVCLGTMGAGKQLDELVEAFNKNGYPLHIAGRFYDKEWYEQLAKKALPNIVIEDKYLSDAEYASLLSSAKYTVLPYAPDKYNTQTSGVLQEAVFMDTCVIAFRDVLLGNNTKGIMIDSWEDLAKEDLKRDYTEITSDYKKQRETIYNIGIIKEKYEKVF